jgi:hypothetical protein
MDTADSDQMGARLMGVTQPSSREPNCGNQSIVYVPAQKVEAAEVGEMLREASR